MALPGWGWLSEHLSDLQMTEGDPMWSMRNPVVGGAPIAVGCVLTVAWLVALPVLLLWAGLRRVLARG